MLKMISDDTLIRSQSSSTNTTSQALSIPNRKLRSEVSSQHRFWQTANFELLNEIGHFLALTGK